MKSQTPCVQLQLPCVRFLQCPLQLSCVRFLLCLSDIVSDCNHCVSVSYCVRLTLCPIATTVYPFPTVSDCNYRVSNYYCVRFPASCVRLYCVRLNLCPIHSTCCVRFILCATGTFPFPPEPRGSGRNAPIVRLTVEVPPDLRLAPTEKRKRERNRRGIGLTRMEDVPRAYRGEKYRH